MLVDGFDIVFDLRKSKGSYVFDAESKKTFPGFLHILRLFPDRIQSSKDDNFKEFMKKLAYVSLAKPSNSDAYTVEMAEFIEYIFKNCHTGIPAARVFLSKAAP